MNSNRPLNTFVDLVNDPDSRFRKFFEYNTKIDIDPKYSIEKYIKSRRELIRMANVYFSEQDYFQAFILYSRYAVLYGQYLKTHPEYSKCNKADVSEINRELNTLVFPKAEKLKIYIKDLFIAQAKEHHRTLNDQKLLDQNEKNENLAQNEQEKSNIENGLIDSMNNMDQSFRSKFNFRQIILPDDTIDKFLEKAFANTIQNIETCGILAGKLTHNKFFISHVVVPKQKGTSDTCSTENENEICQVIDQNDLITLGWIHTHPSQTAFLSSIDLHTHYGYQIMIPEAIAIVCAPSYSQNGLFILNQEGLREISECNLNGFHPHSKIPQLFDECDHVIKDKNIKINIIDLRMISNISNIYSNK